MVKKVVYGVTILLWLSDITDLDRKKQVMICRLIPHSMCIVDKPQYSFFFISYIFLPLLTLIKLYLAYSGYTTILDAEYLYDRVQDTLPQNTAL